jgi:serine/threonine protein kinase
MAAEIAPGKVERQEMPGDLEAFRDWLAAGPTKRGHALRRGYQAGIEVFHSPAGSYVVKSPRGFYLWRRIGRASLRREHQAYVNLTGIRGVPRCLGMLEDGALVLEYIEGDTLRKREHTLQHRDAFFEQLLATIRGLHAAGVAHGDLKRKDNILVGPGEQPYLVDFGVASIEARRHYPWSSAVYRWMRQYDYNAWVKHKYRRQLSQLDEADAALYRPTWPEQVARIIRVIWQKLTFRRLRKRLLAKPDIDA